jgi:hypothetical protein
MKGQGSQQETANGRSCRSVSRSLKMDKQQGSAIKKLIDINRRFS